MAAADKRRLRSPNREHDREVFYKYVSAKVATLIGCCELADADPVEYLTDILPRLARGVRLCDVPALLPARWKAARAAAAASAAS